MQAQLEHHRQALVAASTIALVAMLALPPMLGFGLDLASFIPLFALAGVLAVFLPYVAWRRLDALRTPLEATTLGLVLVMPVLVFTYAAMRVGAPLADGLLIAIDNAIGFDWSSFVRTVDRSHAAAYALALAYSSFSLQLLLLPSLLCIARRPDRAYDLVLAYLILCTLAALCSIPFPSMGAYVAAGFDPDSLRHVNAHFGYFFLESFQAVRTQPDFVLALGNAAGIITFPSVHAGVAAICAWAAWPTPLRLPLLALNVLMAVSAIPIGAHYLIDVLAGGLVAAVAVRLVGVAVRYVVERQAAPGFAGAFSSARSRRSASNM